MDKMDIMNRAALKFNKVSTKLGQSNLNTQQGTSTDLYDSLEVLNGKNEYVFYREAGSRVFPLTNLTENGNKLNVGDGMLVQAVYFNFAQEVTEEQEPFSKTWEIETIVDTPAGSFVMGEMDIVIGNQRIIKNIRLATFASVFNKFGKVENQTLFVLDNPFFIPPLVTFEARLRVPNFDYVGQHGKDPLYIQMTMSGFAGMLNMKTTL